MKVITLRIPQPFDEGPQFDEDGFISGSWPAGLPYSDMSQVVKIGQANGGLSLCEFIAADDWPLSSIPNGWRATSAHIWDMSGDTLSTELETNISDYAGHIPDDNDGNTAPYHRLNSWQGWPDIVD